MCRDNKGRFTVGNKISRLGGFARAQKLTKEELSAIGRKGFEATVNRHFGGDVEAAKSWFNKKGLWVQEEAYRENGFYFTQADPGDHPAHKK